MREEASMGFNVIKSGCGSISGTTVFFFHEINLNRLAFFCGIITIEFDAFPNSSLGCGFLNFRVGIKLMRFELHGCFFSHSNRPTIIFL
jgi:hypothetical protein